MRFLQNIQEILSLKGLEEAGFAWQPNERALRFVGDAALGLRLLGRRHFSMVWPENAKVLLKRCNTEAVIPFGAFSGTQEILSYN